MLKKRNEDKKVIAIGLIIVIGISSLSILTLMILPRSYPIILTGDQIFSSTYIISEGQEVTFRDGTFSFEDPADRVVCYGNFTGINLTLEGIIEAYGDSHIEVINSPHTVDEIYAYNFSKIIVNNSIVHVIHAYDNSTVTVDDSLFFGDPDYPTIIYGEVQLILRGSAHISSMERVHPGELIIKIECRISEMAYESNGLLHEEIGMKSKSIAAHHDAVVDIDKSIDICNVRIRLNFTAQG